MLGDIMASTARLVMARGLLSLNGTVASPTYQTQTVGNTTATLALIQNLVFAESKSVRTSTIILAAFNVLASFTTAGSILYDCYWASKRCNPKFKASKFCVSSIHPAETYPLVLAIGIVIQGLVFAGVQGMGLESLFTKGCENIAQFMWPALFIVPYIQLVFGLECTFRSLRKMPFQARGKYDVTICGGVIILMLVATWIPSQIFKEPDACFASLVWFITRYGRLGFIMLSTITGLLIISALTIFIRLSTVNMIDQHQRIAASRMVYYLVLGIVSMAFIIPYFVSLLVGDGDLKAAMMATVVLNLSGLMSGLLQLFLRSNTATTSFGPKGGRSWDRKKHEIRIWGPNELAFSNHLVDPVGGPRTPRAELGSRADSRASLIEGPEKGRVISMESIKSPPFRSPARYNPLATNAVEQIAKMPTIPEPAAELPPQPTSRAHGHTRKQSYSLFPADPTSPSKATTNQSITRPDIDSIYDISDLVPPPAIFDGRGPGHRRDSSIASSATVQIGLRISHAPTPSQEDILALPLAATTYNANPARPSSPSVKVETQNFSKLEPPAKSPRRPSPLNTSVKPPEQSPIRSASINKTLPPTPKPTASALNRVSETECKDCTLTPAVYSPEKKTAAASKVSSPKAVTILQSANPLRNNPLTSPIRPPERSNSGRLPQTRQSKVDWI